MWTILKIDRKKIEFLKTDLKKKLGPNTDFYNPRLLIQKYKNNKLVNKEFNLLGDYLFCFNSDLKNPAIRSRLKFIRGLKYFLDGFIQSQNEIKEFVGKCKNTEKDGYLYPDFFNLIKDKKYKFYSGPFADTIFKIINFRKNEIDILMGNLKTTVNRQKFLFYPV